MADLASSAVTVRRSFEDGDRTGKRIGVIKEVTVVLAAMGTATNKVLASAFGFTYVYSTSLWTNDADSLIIKASPSYDNTYILLSLDATVNVPADVTGTYHAVIRGY